MSNPPDPVRHQESFREMIGSHELRLCSVEARLREIEDRESLKARGKGSIEKDLIQGAYSIIGINKHLFNEFERKLADRWIDEYFKWGKG